ncbi:pleckstrin homology domain-containing family A member 3-like isoform X1 [Schistocerca serialis cubense]|uniref:pleckstrin homology domain-containing family A member 3-like isoform X1 n=1 Tax=Schistocerca serialis cubense TaxID=2023355 RepID=UPI00214EB908|nr:pleckstrin homology domain-containing family A member 3-like isoform X1 [Schistocerca serialis cubense]
MEGVLWKWTNYWSGWQTRWFILDDGVLAYYKSQDEVNQGCKGSMKVSACEIIEITGIVVVNPVDNTRMDLVIPGEQHIYLRAPSSQERQQWLVALGSAKACVTTRSRKDSADSNPDTLKTKKSELRLYCDLLMQQVHMVKTAAMKEGGPEVEKLDEATSLLGATCDTFIRTLEDCMKLSNANFTYELPHQHLTDTALPPVSNQTKSKIIKPAMPVIRSNSSDKKV